MKKHNSKNILDKKLLVYTISGGALLAGASGISAGVHSREINETYNPGTGNHYIDINNDGTDDFYLKSTYNNSTQYSAELVFLSSNQILGQGGYSQTAIFNSGSNILYTNVNWGINQRRLRVYSAPTSSAGQSWGYWEGATEKFAPVKFDISGQMHCGYLKMSLDASMNITVHTVAWENQANTDLTAGALPVELVNFYGELAENTVKLAWETATEVNNYGFEVERQKSQEDSQNTVWEKIGLINGSGTSNSPRQYSFTDSNLPLSDKVSYRLRQIDNDGTFTYSKEVTVDLSTITGIKNKEIQNEFVLLQNYPNPFNPSTAIPFRLVEGGFVNLTIYNMLGEKVTVLINQQMEAGQHQREFNADELPSGTYIYKITVDDKFTEDKKMMVLK